MKILLIAPCFGAYGGIETFVLRLAQQIHQKDHEVVVVFKKVKGFELKKSLIEKSQENPAEIIFMDRFSLKMVQLLRQQDLVHTHNPLIEAIFICRIFQIPVVTTIYNWCRRDFSVRPVLWRIANHFTLRSWYISEFVWDSWEPRNRCKKSDRLPIISELPDGFTPFSERKGFVFVSRWIENKGLRRLIQAYRKAEINPRDWPLTLIGDGPLKEEVLEDLEKNPCKSIEITGFISSEERNMRIRNAKWMVTPPNTKEDLGLTPLEARNVSVPCIVSKDGGLIETGGKGSIWCEPGEVESLRDALEQAASLSENAYRAYAKQTQEGLGFYVSSLDIYISEYRKLLSERMPK